MRISDWSSDVCSSDLLEIMRAGFAYYLTRFPSYTVIYGAFATLPIFLLWIYLSWLAILLGATVAATLPALRQRRWALTQYRSEEHTSELQSLMRNSYAVLCLNNTTRADKYTAQQHSLYKN